MTCFVLFSGLLLLSRSHSGEGWRCDDHLMDDVDAAQAAELLRALRDQLHLMNDRLVRLERQEINGTNDRASAIQREAAELRLDISEAQNLIKGLQRRYLNRDGHAQPHPPAITDHGIATRRWWRHRWSGLIERRKGHRVGQDERTKRGGRRSDQGASAQVDARVPYRTGAGRKSAQSVSE